MGIGAEPQEAGFLLNGQMERSGICTFNINPLLACFWTSLNLAVQKMVRSNFFRVIGGILSKGREKRKG